MRTMMVLLRRVFFRNVRDRLDDRPEPSLTERGVRIMKLLRLGELDERCSSCLAIEAEYWLLIGAPKFGRSLCRLRG